MAALKHSSSRDAWIMAWTLALMLHALAIVGIRRFPPIGGASATRPAQLEPVQLVFSPPSPTPTKEEKPHFFSELPPDRKDVAPKKADFLSNVTSRARDNVSGGDGDLPRMKGEGDAPMVSREPNGGSSHPAPSSPAPPPTPPSPPQTTPRPSSPSAGAAAARRHTDASVVPERRRDRPRGRVLRRRTIDFAEKVNRILVDEKGEGPDIANYVVSIS